MFSKTNILNLLLLAPVLLTPFIYSNELYNGVISAKQFWFYGAMALLMAGTGLQMLFSRKPLTISFNKIDIALLAFYTYYLVRAATTPYMPLLENQRFLNWTLCIILYFIVKRACGTGNLNTETQRHGGNRIDAFGIDKLNTKTRGHEEGAEENRENSLRVFVSSCSFSGMLTGFLILTALGQAIWGLLQLYGFLPSFNSNFKITGTFFNPAPYALYLAVIFPMALGTYLQLAGDNNKEVNRKEHEGLREEHKGFFSALFAKILAHFSVKSATKYLSLPTVIAILLVLPATMIRAAWLGALAGTLVVLQYKYHYIQRIKQFLNTPLSRIGALAVTLTLVVSLGAGIYFLKKDSANGKLFIWEVTVKKWVETPSSFLFGHGVGRFEAEYNNWQAEYFQNHPKEMDGPKGWVAGNTKYAFNEFLEITSEIGNIGLLLFLAIIAVVLFSHFQITSFSNSQIASFSNSQILKSSHSQIIFSSLQSLLLISAISFPFYSLPTFILFLIILANNSALRGRHNEIKINAIQFENWYGYLARCLIYLVSLGLSLFLLLLLNKQYKAYWEWNVSEMLNADMSYDESCNVSQTIYPQLQFNGDFLQCYGEKLLLNQQHFLSLNLFIQASKYRSSEKLHIYFGNTHKALKKYKQAETHYILASKFSPYRFRPLYCLAKLYMFTGQEQRARSMAYLILSKRIKVPSRELTEIHKKMNLILLETSNSFKH